MITPEWAAIFAALDAEEIDDAIEWIADVERTQPEAIENALAEAADEIPAFGDAADDRIPARYRLRLLFMRRGLIYPEEPEP